MNPIERIMISCGIGSGRALICCAILMASLWPGGASSSDLIERALTLVDQERYSEARGVLERAPKTPRVRLVQGILQAREGNVAQAIAIFERLRSDHPELVEPYNNLAVLYADQGRLEEARGVLISALERRPDAVLYANLGDVYIRLADRAYDRARRLSADRSEASMTFAESATPSAATSGSLKGSEAASPKGEGGRVGAGLPRPGTADVRKRASAAPKDGECVRSGRFTGREAATKAAEWLQLRGAEVLEIRREERRIVKNYWVRLPGLESEKAVGETLRKLRRLGVRDVAILAKSGRSKTISLGVYRSKHNMQRRVLELEKLGYKALSGANAEVVRGYVIKARSPEDRSVLRDAWAKRFPGHPMRYVSCSGSK